MLGDDGWPPTPCRRNRKSGQGRCPARQSHTGGHVMVMIGGGGAAGAATRACRGRGKRPHALPAGGGDVVGVDYAGLGAHKGGQVLLELQVHCGSVGRVVDERGIAQHAEAVKILEAREGWGT